MKRDWEIDAPSGRIDQWLSQELGLSRARVKAAVQDGAVTVNGETVKVSYQLSSGDQVSLNLEEEALQSVHEIVPIDMDLDIYHEDEDILVINKPAGRLVYPPPPSTEPSIVHGALAHCEGKLAMASGTERPGVVHRLDRLTEGLLLMAKNDTAYYELTQQFKERKVKKKYYAKVKGDLIEDEFEINRPIGAQERRRLKQSVHTQARNSKPAITKVKVLERYQSATLVDITLVTGRTHQIRVHFAAIGHPVLGDSIYGDANKPDIPYALQAYLLGFFHPRTKEWMEVSVPVSARLGGAKS